MTAEVLPIRRGRPTNAEIRGIERRVRRLDDRDAWGRVVYLTGRGHLSVVADRPDMADHTFGEIRSIASRRLRQLGGPDAA